MTDMASEIILTLGQAFEVAYQIEVKEAHEEEPADRHPGSCSPALRGGVPPVPPVPPHASAASPLFVSASPHSPARSRGRPPPQASPGVRYHHNNNVSPPQKVAICRLPVTTATVAARDTEC